MGNQKDYLQVSASSKKATRLLMITGAATFAVGVFLLLFGAFTAPASDLTYFAYYLSLVVLPVGFLAGLFGLYGWIGTFIADLAASKGRSWGAFFWLTILFSPIIMWIIAASVSPLPGSATYISPVSESLKPDVSDQLKKLSELHKEGILTDKEFEAKKKEFLDRL